MGSGLAAVFSGVQSVGPSSSAVLFCVGQTRAVARTLGL